MQEQRKNSSTREKLLLARHQCLLLDSGPWLPAMMGACIMHLRRMEALLGCRRVHAGCGVSVRLEQLAAAMLRLLLVTMLGGLQPGRLDAGS